MRVTFGAALVTEFQVEGASSAEEEEWGQERRHVRPKHLADREPALVTGLAKGSSCQRTGEAAGQPRQAAAPSTDRRRAGSASEVGRLRPCRCGGCQRDNCRRCAHYKDMPRYNGKNRLK